MCHSNRLFVTAFILMAIPSIQGALLQNVDTSMIPTIIEKQPFDHDSKKSLSESRPTESFLDNDADISLKRAVSALPVKYNILAIPDVNQEHSSLRKIAFSDLFNPSRNTKSLTVNDIYDSLSEDDNEEGEKQTNEISIETTFETSDDSRKKIQEIIKRSPALSRIMQKNRGMSDHLSMIPNEEDSIQIFK